MNDPAIPPNPPVASAPGSLLAPTEPPASERPQYEFNDAQNQIITDLAMAIVWVRVPLLIVGLFQAIIATGLIFRIPRDGAHIVGVLGHALAAIVCFVLASWLMRAASEFLKITSTKGRDVSHLMSALKSLDAWFDLLAFFVKLYLVMLGALLVVLLIGSIWGAFRGPA